MHTNSDDNNVLSTFKTLLAIVDELREKCPWEREQTMASLRHLTIEETFELSEAILEGNTAAIREELGDLLWHIVSYARMASEQRFFSINEVIQTLCDKLMRRNPHIYAQKKAEDTETVEKNWEEIKLKERKNKSVLDGVPKALPSLIKAMRIQEKASRVGVDWQKKGDIAEQVKELVQKINCNTADLRKLEDTFGEVFFTLVRYAQALNVNAENALEEVNKKFIQRFQSIEQQVAKQGKQITQLSTEKLMSYWKKAKQLAIWE